MQPFRVAVTIRSFSSGDLPDGPDDQIHPVFINHFGRRMTGDEIIRYCHDADAIIAGTEKFSRDVLQNLPALKVISRVGVGTDSIDLVYARERGIAVYTTPEATIPAVAEHTLALILSLSRNIPRYSLFRTDPHSPVIHGHMVRGSRLGIVGLGRIGREIARLTGSLGAKILYYDPYVQVSPDPGWDAASSLSYLLSHSDIISLHSPPLPDGAPILGENEFSLIKHGAILINTARGSLIDEQALIQALDRGTIRAAGLDVTVTEPYQGPLLRYPQVIITPHVASNTEESRKEMETEAIENIRRFMGSNYE